MNNTRSASQMTYVNTEDMWLAFDALPVQVRWALHEATGPFSPSDASSACQEFGPDAVVKIIWSTSKSECRAWNDAYLAQHGRDTPAYAARATIQPYGRRA